jgi:hypothetical protein
MDKVFVDLRNVYDAAQMASLALRPADIGARVRMT